VQYEGSSSSQGSLSSIKYEVRESHEELPYFIHAKTNVPYLVGRQGHTVIAVELKKFGWSIRLRKTKENLKDIVAKKNDEKWHIRVKTIDARLSDVLRNLPVNAEEIDELIAVSEKEKALPVIAAVASDSAVLLSAKTFKALSP
jgi:Holliday junction resolvase